MDIGHLFTVITCITQTATKERGRTGEKENGQTPEKATRMAGYSESLTHNGNRFDIEEVT